MRDMGAIPRAWEGKMSSQVYNNDMRRSWDRRKRDSYRLHRYTWLVRLSGTRKVLYLEAIAAPEHHRQVEALGAIRSDP